MTTAGWPDLADVKAYMGQTATTYADAALTAALAAEKAAQGRVCRRPAVVSTEAPLPADLAEALLRRTARNVAMRRVPLGVQQNGETSTAIGASDPEVRRLEKPFRKVVLG